MFLIYGNGFIANKIIVLLTEMNHKFKQSNVYISNFNQTDVYNEILEVNPQFIICALGKTSGKGFNNIDYLESIDTVNENINSNLYAPLLIAQLINKYNLNIHMTYIGTGCIYNGNNFTETDIPNFSGSMYSTVKAYTDQLIVNYNNVLNCRIRMPITDINEPRNFITKILNYYNLIDIDNSVTYLNEFLPIIIDMTIKNITGTFNCVNKGSISAFKIASLYREHIDKNHECNKITLSELDDFIIGKRSNNTLNTDKISQLYNISNINDIIVDIITNYHINN